jgi:Cysteine rich repeat
MMNRNLRSTLALTLGICMTTTIFAQQRDAMKACASDVKTLCSNIERGDGRIAKCLKENESKLSAECRAKLQAAGAARGTGERGRRNSNAAPATPNN